MLKRVELNEEQMNKITIKQLIDFLERCNKQLGYDVFIERHGKKTTLCFNVPDDVHRLMR